MLLPGHFYAACSQPLSELGDPAAAAAARQTREVPVELHQLRLALLGKLLRRAPELRLLNVASKEHVAFALAEVCTDALTLAA